VVKDILMNIKSMNKARAFNPYDGHVRLTDDRNTDLLPKIMAPATPMETTWSSDVASAYTGPDILLVDHETGHDPATSPAQNDAHSFFKSVDGQVVTGPTLTNINDFRAILVSPTT